MRIELIKLESDERILLQVRKHWFLLVVQFMGILVAAVAPLVAYGFLLVSPLSSEIERISNTGALIAGYSAWLTIVWMTLFNIWNNYYLDIWTITNKRIIAIDQHGFFRRTAASFRLDRLQDVYISVNGIIETLLDYGTLEAQTAGEEMNFKARGLPHPGELKALILSASDEMSPSNIAQSS